MPDSPTTVDKINLSREIKPSVVGDTGTVDRLNEAPRDIWDKLRLISVLCDDIVALAPDFRYKLGSHVPQERWDVIRPNLLAEANGYGDIVLASSAVSPFDAVDMALAIVAARGCGVDVGPLPL